jgi:hypothetical protein
MNEIYIRTLQDEVIRLVPAGRALQYSEQFSKAEHEYRHQRPPRNVARPVKNYVAACEFAEDLRNNNQYTEGVKHLAIAAYEQCERALQALSNRENELATGFYADAQEIKATLERALGQQVGQEKAKITEEEKKNKQRSNGGKTKSENDCEKVAFKAYCREHYLSWRDGIGRSYGSGNAFAKAMTNPSIEAHREKNTRQKDSKYGKRGETIVNETAFTRGGKYGWIKQWKKELADKNATP